jgi:cytochrome d ubiquinol oxidase subunit I
MIAIGFAMLGLGLWGLYLRARGRLYEAPLFHRAAILMAPTGFIAVLAGWITTEVGRQPFTVYGLLRTADSLSPVEAPAVATSLLMFIVVYFFVFGAGTYYILSMMNKPAHTRRLGLREAPVRAAGPIASTKAAGSRADDANA